MSSQAALAELSVDCYKEIIKLYMYQKKYKSSKQKLNGRAEEASSDVKSWFLQVWVKIMNGQDGRVSIKNIYSFLVALSYNF